MNQPIQPIQPIYLLADSQLLFWENRGERFLASILNGASSRASAAYIGASNGDAPEFFQLFREAIGDLPVSHCCRHIQAAFPAEDARFLEEADVILLAGGDVERGWQSIRPMAECIRRRYLAGAVLIGVSAGAVQLGLYGSIERNDGAYQLIDTLKLVPFLIAAHDERRDWIGLATQIELLDDATRGIGIPSGGGLAYHPDHTLEAIRHPLHEIVRRDGRTVNGLILPGD